jgi:uncharacterized protein YukE
MPKPGAANVTRIRMVTEAVRQVAQGLSLGSNELEDLPSDLKNLSEGLSAAWQGGNVEHYVGEIRNLAGDLQGEIDNIGYISSRLNNEVSEWENVDSTFGKVISSIKAEVPAGKPWWETSEEKRSLVNNVMDFGKGLATIGVISGITAGTSYAGQVIFHGGQGLKSAAGISSHLTHIKASNLPGHLLKQSSKISVIEVGMAAWEFADKGAKDWANYESGSEKAVALGIDGLFVAGKTFIQHHAAHIVTTMAVSALVAAGAPAVGIAAAGLAVWWGSSYATGLILDNVYEVAESSGVKDSIVKKGGSLIDSIGKGIQNAARSVDRAFSPIVQRTIAM